MIYIYIMRIYIDTSVINGLYAQDDRIKADTVQFFRNVRMLNYRLYASEAAIEVNRINRREGFPEIEISSPKEV